MRWRYLPLVIIFLSLTACTNMHPRTPPPWASTSSNQMLLDQNGGPIYTETTPSRALLVIESVACGDTSEEAYLVEVSWVTTADDPDFARIEYEILARTSATNAVAMNKPQVALEETESVHSGSFTIKIPGSEIRELGDKILVHLVVGEDSEETFSPIESYNVSELCSF